MLKPGLQATIEETVGEAMTAVTLGSGDVPVLGTPAVVALAERASCSAIEDHLSEGQTSVGAWVELSHLAPTPQWAVVKATSRLTQVEGSKLTFEFAVTDPGGEVARGVHRRVLVNRDQFLRQAGARPRET